MLKLDLFFILLRGLHTFWVLSIIPDKKGYE